ncbi:MAG: hypothetical protein IKA99_05470 [Clostridia bacterium]|nr:hypothetical protein [Clostridia bacterium]
MKEYKVVPCQGKIVAKKSADIQREMLVYANVIAQETVGGWYLVSSMPVTVASSKKRFRGTELPYNVLVFARDKAEEEK